MATDLKVTISLHRDVLRHVEAEGRKRGLTRSAMIEQALRAWQQMDVYRQLADGYVANREADRAEAESWLPLVVEALDGERAGGNSPRRSVARRVRRKRK